VAMQSKIVLIFVLGVLCYDNIAVLSQQPPHPGDKGAQSSNGAEQSDEPLIQVTDEYVSIKYT